MEIYVPQEAESLEQYFGRYTDVELREILSNPESSLKFCDTLLRTLRLDLSEPEKQLQTLWDQVKDLNTFGRLRQFVHRLKPVRRNLLISLEETANHLELYTKYGSVFRLIVSITDITGIMGGFWMRNSSFDYSGYAFSTAAASGYLCPLITIAEFYLSKIASDDILMQLRKDHSLFDQIQRWFQQTEMLEKTIRNIFPFDTAEDIVDQFSETARTGFSGLDLLAKLFRKLIERSISPTQDINLVKNIIALCTNTNFRDLYECLNIKNRPIFLDIMKIMLQLQYNPTKLALGQIQPALQVNQTLWSIPGLGRTFLNFATMLDAVNTLRKSEISSLASEMRYLKEELENQLDVLERITESSASRSNLH